MKTDPKPQIISRVRESKIIAEIDAIKHSFSPENSSEVISLLDRIINMRSEKMIQLMYEELSKAGMVNDLREINRTLVLRLMVSLLTEFQKREGHFPELRKGASEEEYLLAALFHFQINGQSLLFSHSAEVEA